MSDNSKTTQTFSGDKLREAREAAGVTQRDVAMATGKTDRTVGNWETGTGRPDANDMAAIVRLTGKPYTFFYVRGAA